jgi:hypothetical protein
MDVVIKKARLLKIRQALLSNLRRISESSADPLINQYCVVPPVPLKVFMLEGIAVIVLPGTPVNIQRLLIQIL